ncbi:N-terminal 7TM region of histidine kinase [Granulicatella balaenopterae]|uniref:N-terminal 7TM region of histidine kinase n=1 Tax=Granulicatella balaenopterae TaxID=137733 RepID=A0A1H9IS49_9LACT|nr:histidine kinase N-terminal 7TM domain-containing protein [Granulicatella balaenopterae]SEQ77400.1 N-terminal 7TM region of histidine kinase [Granulicatella balaenopterae]
MNKQIYPIILQFIFFFLIIIVSVIPFSNVYAIPNFQSEAPTIDITRKRMVYGEITPYTELICHKMSQQNTHFVCQEDTDWRSNIYQGLQQQQIYAVSDIEAFPAIKSQLSYYWYPQVLVTPIIALDLDQMNSQTYPITGWRDLEDSDYPIGINASSTELIQLLAAISYGLEGEEFTTDSAIQFLQKINLQENTDSTPIILCFDCDAVKLIQEGRHLKIIVPKEGTISYQLGLLSNILLTDELPDAHYLQMQLRLLDGTTTNPYYPASEAYKHTTKITDYHHFHQQMKRTGAKFRRLVRHIRLYSAADDKESILFAMIAIILTLAWLEYALYRAINPNFRRAILILGLMIIGWILVRMFKYQLIGLNAIGRYCWYSYYIFQLAHPLILLYVADMITQFEPKKQMSHWLYPFFILYPIFVLLVFTNDWHRLVFNFDIHGNWSDIYSYQPVYYLIYLYAVSAFFLAIYLLIKKSHTHANNYALVLVVACVSVIMLYSICYVKGIPFARDSDITITQCLFSLLLFEVILQTGLIPTNRHYQELFANAPLNMKIIDQDGQVFLKGLTATPLSASERQVLANEKTAGSIKKDKDNVIFLHKIHGGTMLWQENITQLHQLQASIDEAIQQLLATNHLLVKQKEIEQQKISQQITSDLFKHLEVQMEEKRQLLLSAIRTLEQATSPEEVSILTSHITLLLCHIKRRCNLFFIQEVDQQVTHQELLIYLNELHQFLDEKQCHCHIQAHLDGHLMVEDAILLYDFYFSVLTTILAEKPFTMLSQIHHQKERYHFSILMDKAICKELFSEEFLEALRLKNGQITLTSMDDLTKITCEFL